MFENEKNEVNKVHSNSDFIIEKRTYTVAEIQEILNIGRNAAYDLVKQNLFNIVKIGNSIRISKKSFDEWLDNCNSSDHN